MAPATGASLPVRGVLLVVMVLLLLFSVLPGLGLRFLGVGLSPV